MNVVRVLLRLVNHVRRPTTMSQLYAFEEQVAVTAVRRACQLTNSVFNTLIKGETVTKDDKSPVTSEPLGFNQRSKISNVKIPVADYASQAVIASIIRSAFPDDPI